MLNNQPERSPDTKQKSNIRQALHHLWKKLTYRWGWKLVSLILAICLWGGLINEDASLTREKVFSDVPISITNSDTLLRNGLIVVSGLDNLPGLQMRVDVPQKLYSTVTPSNYNVRIDLSKIKTAGEQTVTVSATSTTTYGTVTDMSVTQVNVVVEEYITRSRIPVRIETTGEISQGLYAAAASVDPPLVTISGPRSLVDTVVRCVAQYDLSMLSVTSGTERTSVPFVLYDRYGEIVDNNKISVTSESVKLDSILVEQSVYPTKSIDVNTLGVVTGTVAEGYEVKAVTFQPAVLTIAAEKEVLDGADMIYLNSTMDISGATKTMTRNISVNRGNGIVYSSADTVSVTVEIEESIKTKVFSGIQIKTTGLSGGLSVSLSARQTDVTVTGTENTLKKLTSGKLALSVDLTGFEEGEYTLPVSCVINDGENVYTVDIPDVVAVITKK